MRRRFQFSLKWMFVAMLAVATFFGGMAVQRQIDAPISIEQRPSLIHVWRTGGETITLRDGSLWMKVDDNWDD